jgi:hypothetical protein
MKSSFLEKFVSKKKRLRRLKDRVLTYYDKLPPDQRTTDQDEVIRYLKNNDIAVFPYLFPEKYLDSDIELKKDDAVGLYYTHWEGKKLYYKNGTNPRRARQYFNSLRLEQDTQSPHRYLTQAFDVAEGEVVIDIGAAEGNFSLSIIEKAKAIYLFETDSQWIKALQATFSPWRDKITIVQRYVSDETKDGCITLDDYFDDDRTIHFMKADVEGAEGQVLRGAARTIAAQPNLKIAICTYHRQEDAENLDNMLKAMGFHNEFSDGFMLYYYGRNNVVREPFLRKAVLRATKST